MLGHEITGEVVEAGPDVELITVGDLVSVPSTSLRPLPQLQGGQDRHLPERQPYRPGSAYGYVDMGGWVGGQAEYVSSVHRLEPPEVPGPRPGAGEDPRPGDAVRHLPDRIHGAVTAGVGVGSTVYIAGAGPVGLAAAAGAQLLGAAVVIVGDLNEDRLAQARSSDARR